MANYGNSNGATILTVPANRVWKGSVQLAAASSGNAGDASMSAAPSVTISGSGADNYADGDTVVSAALALPTISLTAVTGVSSATTATSGDLVIRTRANPVSLVLNLPARVVGNALATGELI